MLGRKNYTQEELDHNKALVDRQLAAYRALVKAAGAATDKKVGSAFDAFETLFFNNMLLALDRPFVHRIRAVTGKDGNPLNEVELLCESLMNDDDGILRGNNVIKLIPEEWVLKLQIGDPIRLTADEFERLAAAFLPSSSASSCSSAQVNRLWLVYASCASRVLVSRPRAGMRPDGNATAGTAGVPES